MPSLPSAPQPARTRRTRRTRGSLQQRLLSGLAPGLVAGVAGTAAMTASTALEKRLRPELDHPVDYDASSHVADAVGVVLRHDAETDAGRLAYFLLAHWGYGPAVALAHPWLADRLGEPRATLAFYAGSQVMAMTLFPTIGGTPAPWRWERDVLATSFGQHAVYALSVSLTGRLLRSRRCRRPR